MRDPTDLIGQELEAQDQQSDAQRRALQETEDIKWLMAHEAGRRIVSRILAFTKIAHTPFNHSGSVTAFNCGQQNVGLWLLGEVQAHRPEAYLKMLQEQRKNDN